MPVHLLKYEGASTKFSSVWFDESEDEELSVLNASHLRSEDFVHRVEGLSGGIGRT